MKYFQYFLLSNIVFLLILQMVFPKILWSMPYFARKYKASCTLCHTTYPKVNALGEAYRINGYRIPKGGEEGMTQIKPTPLGGTVPSSIAGIFPAGAMAQLWMFKEKRAPYSFELHELEFFFASNLGDTFSFWSDFKPIDGGTHPAIPFGRTFLMVSNILGKMLPHNVLNAKFGYYEPETNAFSSHRRLLLQPYLYHNTRVVTTTGISPSAFRGRDSQVGAELNGVLTDRIFYAVGILNGSNNINDQGERKDYYTRVAWKPWGMHFNGAGGSEDGIRVGSFFYYGQSEYLRPQFLNRFSRVGGDLQLNYRGFELASLYQFGEDENPDRNGDRKYTNSVLVEFSYNRILNLVTPAVRYELFGFHDPRNDLEQYIVSAIADISPNFRLTLEGLLFREENDGNNKVTLEARYAY